MLCLFQKESKTERARRRTQTSQHVVVPAPAAAREARPTPRAPVVAATLPGLGAQDLEPPRSHGEVVAEQDEATSTTTSTLVLGPSTVDDSGDNG